MACNENIIKNIANEVSRNCQQKNQNVEVEFVVYLIEFLLLNPKYGKLFTKNLNRNNLEYFVQECVSMLTCGETSINTLKMQFIIFSNYDRPQILMEKHMDSIETCLRPLVNEILDTDPKSDEDINQFSKLYRKISIYIVLASGLGNPGVILTLKEGMAALESVFTQEDLYVFVALPRPERMTRLKELMGIVSGVRLFNRDCKLSGDGIPDLPFNVVDAGKACLASLSHSLVGVMQRVNRLTTAISDSVTIEEETGNIVVKGNTDLTVENYKQVFDLLSFTRQHEVFVRRLLADVEELVASALGHVDRFQGVLTGLHEAVKYKEAVPIVTVFPLFTRLWHVWRAMQNTMYVVSTVNLLMQSLASIQDRAKMPLGILEMMLRGRAVLTDQERMATRVSMSQRLSLVSMANYQAYSDVDSDIDSSRQVHLLGFCAICLSVGALVPSNMKIGLVKHKRYRYGFCTVKMAARFSKDPQRYVNEVLEYARSNPHIISLLGVADEVRRVRDVDTLVAKFVTKVQLSDKDVQTVPHPLEEYIEKNYSWNLWKWKRRACQWATIVNCQTHSTQTDYSHLRSEIHCQTVEPRDKCQQTKKDAAINTDRSNFFVWGRQLRDRQHGMDFATPHARDKMKAHTITACNWPCTESRAELVTSSSAYLQTSSTLLATATREIEDEDGSEERI